MGNGEGSQDSQAGESTQEAGYVPANEESGCGAQAVAGGSWWAERKWTLGVSGAWRARWTGQKPRIQGCPRLPNPPSEPGKEQRDRGEEGGNGWEAEGGCLVGSQRRD